ncbi:MAG TPA: hypothetical protein VLN49_14440 [Gemmatimonadaceae bacterium]|nr:hypothetical protein [Gemmatimonadaceae bacterium]
MFLRLKTCFGSTAAKKSFLKRIIVSPTYHIDIAGYASGADRKWVDNLLSHFEVPGVEQRRRGAARRVTQTGLYHIALVRAIAQELGAPIKTSVALATTLMRAHPSELPIFGTLTLRFDRDRFQRDVDVRVAEAVEAIVPARRGRPPARGIG